MSKLSQKHLLGIKDITREDIELIFETADNFKAVINRPIKKILNGTTKNQIKAKYCLLLIRARNFGLLITVERVK